MEEMKFEELTELKEPERPVARQRWPVPLKWEQQGSDMG